MNTCFVYDLGLLEYGKALELQHKVHEARKTGAAGDTLLLVEHPPVITKGRRAHAENIVAPPEKLSQEGIPVFQTERGGDVTFHGPGQLVAYPVLNLAGNNLSVTGMVWNLEEVTIRTLAALGIEGERIPDWRGVFVGRDKICSLGLRIAGGVSMHGLALNVNTDLKYFDYIVPCGLNGIKVTSVQEIKGQPIDMPVVREIMVAKFADVFRFNCEKRDAREIA